MKKPRILEGFNFKLLISISGFLFFYSCEAFTIPEIPQTESEVFENYPRLTFPDYSYNLAIYPEMVDTLELDAPIALALELNTGALLYAKNIDQTFAPASLTKVVANLFALEQGKITQASLNQIITYSSAAWAQNAPPDSSLMFLGPNQRTSQLDLLRGLMISSGNDAAIALSEHVSGGPGPFISGLNIYLNELGLHNSVFMESSGYSPLNQSTARELAYVFTKYIQEYPWIMEMVHQQEEFSYPRRENSLDPTNEPFLGLTQTNRNLLIGRYEGANGLKTGFIEDSGFHLAATAKKNDLYVLVLIVGIEASSTREGSMIRAEQAEKLLDWSFDQFALYEIDPPPLDSILVWGGANVEEIIVDPEMYTLVLPKKLAPQLKIKTNSVAQILAPVATDRSLGYSWIEDSQGRVIAHKTHGPDREIESGALSIFEEIGLAFRDLFSNENNRKILELGFDYLETQIEETL
jgi:D-alanyl-D-alanine carboxypeptidase (penicillin-binding protein 5/6)